MSDTDAPGQPVTDLAKYRLRACKAVGQAIANH